jgi:hypothetical protein
MRRGSAETLAWWLLPWLVARLLVPAGFMPVSAAGEVGWVLCSAAAAGADSRGTPLHDTAGLHKDGLCPFAAAATLAAPPLPDLAAARWPVPARLLVPEEARRPASTGAASDHWARGPPRLS